ncbi:unnamed protein product [Prunus armeniaca]
MFYRLDGTVRFQLIVTHQKAKQDMLSHECNAFVAIMDSIKIPTRVEEAFNDPKWVEAMNIEMEAL